MDAPNNHSASPRVDRMPTMRDLGITYSQAIRARTVRGRRRVAAYREITAGLRCGRSVESIVSGTLTDMAVRNGVDKAMAGIVADQWMYDWRHRKCNARSAESMDFGRVAKGMLRPIEVGSVGLDATYMGHREAIERTAAIVRADRWDLEVTDGHVLLVLLPGEYTPDERVTVTPRESDSAGIVDLGEVGT